VSHAFFVRFQKERLSGIGFGSLAFLNDFGTLFLPLSALIEDTITKFIRVSSSALVFDTDSFRYGAGMFQKSPG
jgi:hypothetical protein